MMDGCKKGVGGPDWPDFYICRRGKGSGIKSAGEKRVGYR